jgi:hypothetical protein
MNITFRITSKNNNKKKLYFKNGCKYDSIEGKRKMHVRERNYYAIKVSINLDLMVTNL